MSEEESVAAGRSRGRARGRYHSFAYNLHKILIYLI